jgi:hypothetical protein
MKAGSSLPLGGHAAAPMQPLRSLESHGMVNSAAYTRRFIHVRQRRERYWTPYLCGSA